MKTTLQFLFLFFCAFSMSSQSTIQLKINHLLNQESFEFELESKNNLDNKFMLDRLEYYLSTFSIIHDGGQITPIEDLYVLVQMGDETGPVAPFEIDLGEFDIQNIESLNFYFGIDAEANHSDPSLWSIDHPLAPKFPSMHWGWAAGYRFIALEGLSGPNINQELQFHCVGDEFYKEMSFAVTMSGQEEYIVEIDANYEKLLSEINISNGLIIHGNQGEMKTLADNLMDKVFTLSEVTSTKDSELVNVFEAFPNPSNSGLISLNVDVIGENNIIRIHDSFGRIIQNYTSNVKNINLGASGLYYLSLMDSNGTPLATRKIVVQ